MNLYIIYATFLLGHIFDFHHRLSSKHHSHLRTVLAVRTALKVGLGSDDDGGVQFVESGHFRYQPVASENLDGLRRLSLASLDQQGHPVPARLGPRSPPVAGRQARPLPRRAPPVPRVCGPPGGAVRSPRWVRRVRWRPKRRRAP